MRESKDLEFKETITNSFLKTVSAFANYRDGKIIFGIGCGIFTMLIRVYGSYPEGVSFAILLMNVLTPHIDNFCISRAYKKGGGKKDE